ncbi:YcxB family protein [Flaviaesturariibacter amylovorans]|uniref:YcxB-like C-terminal domain-containing protein n=1 Tax=Flaviaesturariibacter amylovorans TaxID=1084520 RepID=A0ABP8G787_9BACT
MNIHFSYDKKAVLQALRFHFLSLREIRLMIIVVNVFALLSAVLFYMKKIYPLAFLLGSFLWFSLMIVFWFLMPALVYRRNDTFKDHFDMNFNDEGFSLGNERGTRRYDWTRLSKFMETPAFFYFYFDPRTFFIIPKSAFTGTDDVHSLRQLLREKVKV